MKVKQKIKKILAHVTLIYFIISLFIFVKLEYRSLNMVNELNELKIERNYYRDHADQLKREIYGMNKEIAQLRYGDNQQTTEKEK